MTTAATRPPAAGAVPSPRRSTGAPTVAAMALAAAERYGPAPAQRFARDGRWSTLSYAGLGSAVVEIAGGLIASGVRPGDRVAVLADTRPEWTWADLGALCAGATVVPVYPTSSPEECEYILSHSQTRVVICGGPEHVRTLRAAGVEALDLVVSLDAGAGDAVPLDELRRRGRATGADAVRERAAAVTPDDLCTIVYTSGTTGRPKGCMLTHGNYRANSDMCASAVDLGDGARIFVFLPLAHSMTRIITMFALDQGHELAYWRGDMQRVMEDVRAVRPTDLPSVPRLFEKIHQAATEATGPKRQLLDWAVARGGAAREAQRAGRRLGVAAQAQHLLADRLVMRRVRDLFGGRVRMVFTGGAPIEPEILRFFDACGILVLEGYGLTENGAAAAMNTARDLRLGTVGRPLPGGWVRIADDGEILIAGPHVFAGYLHDEEATAAALRDAWLHSGDLGELDGDGFLRITGRKKDIIVTSSGKNISPAAIENALRGTRLISQAVVAGDRRPYLVALVTLDPQEAAGLGPAEAREAASRDIEAVNRRFAPPERVKRFLILDRELSHADGELTPTLKVRRAVVTKRFATEIDALYR